MMMILEIVLSLAISIAAAIWIGNYFSRIMPELSPLLDRKPFNCRPCLTFHLTGLFSTLAAILFSSLYLFAAGFIAALAVFVVVRYMDNKKIEE